MSPRLLLNLGLLITVVALSLYVMYSPPPALPPAKPKLTSLKADAIDHIRIQHGNAPDTELQKQDGHWRLIKPVSMPANDYQAQKLAQLAEMPSQSQYPVQADKLDAMGLAKPAITVTLNNVSLQFGTTDPINQFRYVLSGNTVDLIIDAVSHILLQAPASLGDPALLPHHNNITRLVLPKFTLSKDKDGNWQVEGKPPTSLSQDDLMAFIDDWRFAEALRISFVENLYANDKTLPKVIMTLEGTAAPLTFYLDTKANNFTLTRTDSGIRYHMIKEKQRTLLNLPKAEPHPTAPES